MHLFSLYPNPLNCPFLNALNLLTMLAIKNKKKTEKESNGSFLF